MQEKISEIESQGTAPVAIAVDDSLGQVFGAEHPGRVRGVSFGACPSQFFGSKYQRFNDPSSSGNPTDQNRVTQLEYELQQVRHELKGRDEKVNKIEMLLVQVLNNASIPIPPDLATGPDNIVSYSYHYMHCHINLAIFL